MYIVCRMLALLFHNWTNPELLSFAGVPINALDTSEVTNVDYKAIWLLRNND